MKKIVYKTVILSVCLCLLCGCSSRSQDSSVSASEPQPEIQIMTEAELHQYFQQAFDAKGNALDTPEQLNLELAEVQALTVNMTLPEDYEAQYKEWRTEYVESLLKTLQEEYDKIVAEVPLYDGVNAGAAFADYMDFDTDGINELALFYLKWSSQLQEWGFTLEVYGEDSGHAIQYDLSGIETPPLYYLGDSYDPYMMENNYISFAENKGHIYIHIHKEQEYDLYDYYYKVENGLVTVEDEISCVQREGDEWYYSSQKQIEYDEYSSIMGKYSNVIDLCDFTSKQSVMPVKNHGILPQISSDVQRKCAFLDIICTSENNGIDIQYARLADMDGDGAEDLIVVTEGQYLPYFRIYVWNDSELQAIDLNQEMDEIAGIYREKETGKTYVCYYGGAGPYSWYFYERVEEVVKISEENLSWDDVQAQRNRFELVEDLEWNLPLPNSIDTVRQQLLKG